jgi:hypothetical protein
VAVEADFLVVWKIEDLIFTQPLANYLNWASNFTKKATTCKVSQLCRETVKRGVKQVIQVPF